MKMQKRAIAKRCDEGCQERTWRWSRELVDLVVQHQVCLILEQPALVRVVHVIVGLASDLLDILLVGDVGNGQGVLVVQEADLTASEFGIWAGVGDAFRIVGAVQPDNQLVSHGRGKLGEVMLCALSILVKATHEERLRGSADVNDVRATVACARSNGVDEASIFVDRQIVAISKFVVMSVFAQDPDVGTAGVCAVQ